MRTLTCAGKGVPWSGEERKAELTHLYALWRFCGVPTCFLTAAIDDAHQPTTMRLSYGIIDPNEFPATMGSFLENLQNAGKDSSKFSEFHELYGIKLDEHFLQNLANGNPVATTLVYEEIVCAIFTCLIGIAPAYRSKTMTFHKGILAQPRAWSLIHETNARKALHFHAAVHGDPSPTFLARIAENPALMTAVCKHLNSIYRCFASPPMHLLDLARKELGVPRRIQAWFMPTSAEKIQNAMSDATDADTVQLTQGFHRHVHTCHKGPSGKHGCRLARPAGHPVPQTRACLVSRPNAAEHRPASESPRGVNLPRTSAPGNETWWHCEYCRRCDKPGVARDLNFHVEDITTTGASQGEAYITYELERPHIQPSDFEEPIQSLLRDHILSADWDDQEERLDHIQELYKNLAQELHDNFSPMLSSRLHTLKEQEAKKILLRIRQKLRCRNASLVEFLPSLTCLVRCNTSATLLGAGDYAKGSAAYMCKYMIKKILRLLPAPLFSMTLDCTLMNTPRWLMTVAHQSAQPSISCSVSSIAVWRSWLQHKLLQSH